MLSWGSVAITEVIWTLCGIASLLFSRKNLKDILQSKRALREMNGRNLARAETLQILAGGHYRNEMFRIGKATLIVLSGVIAMLIPPANPAIPISPLQVVIVCAIFGIAVQIMLASGLDARQRKLLRRISVEHTQETATHSEDGPPPT